MKRFKYLALFSASVCWRHWRPSSFIEKYHKKISSFYVVFHLAKGTSTKVRDHIKIEKKKHSFDIHITNVQLQFLVILT